MSWGLAARFTYDFGFFGSTWIFFCFKLSRMDVERPTSAPPSSGWWRVLAGHGDGVLRVTGYW